MIKFNKVFLLAVLSSVSFLTKAQTPFYDYEFIDVNNVKAAVSVHGDLWHTWNGGQLTAACEFPKGSGKHLAVAGALWMGGFDQSFGIRAAATTYRDTAQEYWPGPLQGTATSITYLESAKWARIWKLNKADILAFLANSTHTTANTPAVILEWPAKGNLNAKGKNGSPLTITDDLAPFVDVNQDGSYDALSGDYPQMKGDQMLWYVFNDAGPTPHSELSMTEALGVQVAGTIYGYANNTSLKNTVYYEFDILNKYQKIDSFTVGAFADMDLGYALDDYIGYDSTRNMAYTFNGHNTDGMNDPSGYQDSVPIAAIKFLDFPNNNCTAASPLGSFMYFNNDNSPTGNPTNGMDIYNYLNATWRDGTPLRYPSQGQVTNDIYTNGYGGYGARAHYAYDGSYSLPSPWDECYMHDAPGDRRFVVAVKPHTFNQGDHVHLAFALIATDRKKDNGCPSATLGDLNTVAEFAQLAYCDPNITGVNDIGGISDFTIYPNPVTDQLTIQGVQTGKAEITVSNIHGQKIPVPVNNSKGDVVLDTRSLPSGMYLLSVLQNGQRMTKKFTKL